MEKKNKNRESVGYQKDYRMTHVSTSISGGVLQLEISKQGSQFTVGAHDAHMGDESAIRHYETITVSDGWIDAVCERIVGTLNRANHMGRLTSEVLVTLKELGQVIYDALFTQHIKHVLHQTRSEYLKLYLDDQSVHIPWELLHDGEQFICTRFNVGRLVKTQQSVYGMQRRRKFSPPLKMLVLADPHGDLQGAYEEGRQIRDYMDMHHECVHVSFRSGNVSPSFVKEKIRNYDLVHFAGHAEYCFEKPDESGWRMTEGFLSAREIVSMVGNAPMPYLVFSNACQSARTKKWTLQEGFQQDVYGLANAFLLAGVKHYVGTFWEILDEPSSCFSLAFYEHLVSGGTTGEALRMARHALIARYGEESVLWASYILYGDPTASYVDTTQISNTTQEETHGYHSQVEWSGKTRDDIGSVAGPRKARREFRKLFISASIVAFAALLFVSYRYFSDKTAERYGQEAITSYNKGNFVMALDACDALQEQRPKSPVPYIIRGDIFFRKGRLDLSRAAYEKSLKLTGIDGGQKAKALFGLGRIASLKKNFEKALTYYEQGTLAAPGMRQGYISQAFVLKTLGKDKEALHLMGRAHELAPEDHILEMLLRTMDDKHSGLQKREKQNRIDDVVRELSEGVGSHGPADFDFWTSFPLTMWIMGFEVEGYDIMEGQERLMVSGVVNEVLQNGRIRLVERDEIGGVLGEFKFGTSKLIDKKTALSMGRILAARLMVAGRIIYGETQTQVTIRLIETETGQITASINETVGNGVPVSLLAVRLGGALVSKIADLYPLQGKVVHVNGTTVSLNIGGLVGVRQGQRFKVLGEEATLKVTRVQQEMCDTVASEGSGVIAKGMKVKVVSDSDTG